MRPAGGLTTTVSVGTRLCHDGQWYTVTGIESERLRLRDRQGRAVLVHTGAVLSDPATRVEPVGAVTVPAVGPLLDNLDPEQRGRLVFRLGHVREMLTGFTSGMPDAAADGEPRPQYDPRQPLQQRYAAKAAELEVDARTLRRWVRLLRQDGPEGLLDGRSLRRCDHLAGVDQRWLAMAGIVLDEHVDASRPTRTLVLQRIEQRLAAEHGDGVVPVPSRRRADRALTELTRGTNAFTGSTKAKRSIARGPHGVYGRLRATRPGEYLLLDTTPLDVFAMEPVTLRWVRVELTIAMDLYSRVITGIRLAPMSTKSVDAALVLFEALRPDSRRRTGQGLLPYAGLPDLVLVAGHDDQTSGDAAAAARMPGRGLPGVAAETIVVDHGKIYISQHLLAVCDRLGVSVQPARPLTPTDKAAVERFFRTLREQLLEALPGYKGPDVHSRGADPEGCTYFFIDELEQVVREWTAGIYHHRPHAGLADPQVPGLDWSPAEMFAQGLSRTGTLRIPTRADLVLDFLPTAWRTVQHYGIEVGGLRYNGPGLTPYRNRTSPYTGVHAGKWPVRYDTDDVSRVYFQDPADHRWHTLTWEHAVDVPVPFSAEALAYARRLALTTGRHVDDRAALAQLLDRFDAGLTRNPTERRMAIRASQQRQARLAAATGLPAEIADLPAVRAVTDASPDQPSVTQPQADLQADVQTYGDDDCEEDLDYLPADEPPDAGAMPDADYYAGALGVLP